MEIVTIQMIATVVDDDGNHHNVLYTLESPEAEVSQWVIDRILERVSEE